ncbi:hypothetical protein HL669_20810 [Vibrio parahaemolyticus]|uniref:hypothetical protein n=1 Tax=Vibrio parahaemolyticus TaxID=670 RepID=UPI001484E65B|nr:hypothetical protein [Vibrio parahaemolyticus]NNU14055.1 hypothetical protein [Vibrio parahaemolyticus]HCG8132969.1 hypothetical protein [Vibrio parahaemolyticus]
MNWVSDLFKNITVSKTLTSACCLTGLALLVLPLYLPEIFEPLPKLWATVALAITVFTGCLVLFWLVSFLKVTLFGFASQRVKKSRAQNLTAFEIGFIYELGKLADESADLRNIDYDKAPFTKLEILDVCKSLKEKGLLNINRYEENLVYLSENGRQKALQLQREEQVAN